MATPESKVKAHVKRILSRHVVNYVFMPATHGYGASGVPDIVACINGIFVAVECKANGNRPTALQKRNLHQIVAAGGHAFVVDESSTGVFAMTLDRVVYMKAPPELHDFTVLTNEEEQGENK